MLWLEHKLPLDDEDEVWPLEPPEPSELQAATEARVKTANDATKTERNTMKTTPEVAPESVSGWPAAKTTGVPSRRTDFRRKCLGPGKAGLRRRVERGCYRPVNTLRRGFHESVSTPDAVPVTASSPGIMRAVMRDHRPGHRALARAAACLLAAAVTSTASGSALATPCSALGSAPVVFIENGDTQEPLVKRLGQRLLSSSKPLRLVYKNRRTCDLALDMYTSSTMVNDTIPIRYVPSAAEDPTWDPSKPAPTCEADEPGGNPIDLGIGATYLSSCANLPPRPPSLAVTDGPIQAYGFIVPRASSQVAITAEEGYFAYGFPDGTGKAAPWVDQALRLSRGPTASTALTCAAAIGLKASQLQGTVPPKNTSSEVLNLVATGNPAEATIGLMGTEVFDQSRDKVKLLAFRGFGQRYAYYPDSTATSFDKRNVRDGHYLPWAPTPYLAYVDGAGRAKNPNVQRVLDLVVGVRDEIDVSGLEQIVASGLVPSCAMSVTRPFDGAHLSLHAPPEPCTCAFEAKVTQGATTCKACASDATCGTGKCRHGYCEAR